MCARVRHICEIPIFWWRISVAIVTRFIILARANSRKNHARLIIQRLISLSANAARAGSRREPSLEKVRRDRRRGGGRRRKEKEGKSGKKREEKNASKQELARARSEREKETRRREALIRPSGGLKPVFVYPARREYRLSVVRLGVLHSSKYLGIFEESRVPKKTVYSVGRWRDLSRERTSEEKERRRE